MFCVKFWSFKARLHARVGRDLFLLCVDMVLGGLPQCQNSTAPQTLSFTTAVLSSVLLLITAPGNLLVCIAVVKDPYKKLRTPFNIFLLNIAAADLIVGVGLLPLSITYHALEGMRIYEETLLKALHLVFFVSCSASVLGIATLSFDRYLSITSPLSYRSRLSITRVKNVSLLMWIISVACSFTYLYVDFIIFTFVFANTIVLFTLTFLLLVNYKISRNLKSQRKMLQSLSESEIVTSRLAQRDKKVNKTFLLFLVAFVIFNVPSMIISFILNFATKYSCVTHHILRDFQFISILFPSSVNPFIYSLRLPNIRIAVKTIGHRMLPNLFNPEASAFSLWSSSSVSEKVGIGRQRVSPFVEVMSMAKQTVKIQDHNKTILAGGIAEHTVPFKIVNLASMRTGGDNNTIQWISDTSQHALERGTSHFYRETTNV